MKKLILLFTAFMIAAGMYACGGNESDISEISAESIASQAQSEIEESRIPPEEVYDFLSSEYTVTSKREAFGTVYECIYYFVDGAVAGAKVMTTLPDEKNAEEYLLLLSEDYPYATLEGLTLTYYVADDEAYYYDYSLEKLKFVLEKADYEVTVGFDEDEYYSEYSEVSED